MRVPVFASALIPLALAVPFPQEGGNPLPPANFGDISSSTTSFFITSTPAADNPTPTATESASMVTGSSTTVYFITSSAAPAPTSGGGNGECDLGAFRCNEDLSGWEVCAEVGGWIVAGDCDDGSSCDASSGLPFCL